MKAKIIIVMLLVLAVLIPMGCVCGEKKTCAAPEPEKRPCAAAPCGAPAMGRTAQSYPVGDRTGNAICLDKSMPKEVRANEAFQYHIKATNLTNRELNNVVVTEQFPDNLKFQSSTPKEQSFTGNKLQWNLGSLPANGSQMITINAMPVKKGEFATCSDVSYDSLTCARAMVVSPQLVVTKMAPNEVSKCDRIPLTYTVKNTGTGFACDVVLTDQLHSGLMTSDGKDKLVYTIDSLGPGDSKQFQAMVDASSSGKFGSKAVATSKTAGTAESAFIETTVRTPMLTIKGGCPADQYIGKSLTYDIVVSNTGDGVAKDTIIEASVPEGVSFISATENGRYTHMSPGKVTWNVGSLAAGGTKTVSMTVSSDMVGQFKETASARAVCAETVSTACDTTLKGIPGILLEVVDVEDPIKIGGTETYIITATNQGSATDTNVKITCMLEEGMQYVSSTGPTEASVSGNTITFAPLSSLPAKERAEWHIMVKAVGEGNMRFKATMNSDQIGQRPVEETESTTFYKL